MVKSLSLKDIIKVIWKNLWIIILCGIVFGGAFGALAKMKQTTTYTAARDIMIGHNLTETNGRNRSGVLDTDIRMMNTYSKLVKDRSVMNLTQKKLPKDLRKKYSSKDLAGMVSVKSDPNSVILRVKVESVNKKNSVKIANAFTESIKSQLPKLTSDAGEIKLLAKAKTADVSSTTGPSTKKYIVLGLAIGILLGMVVAFTYSTWKNLL